jgi:ubiquinone/menaquinone biosynthesis C-methylase UbiE
MPIMARGREAWQRFYSRRGYHYGGEGNLSLLEPHLKPDMLVLDAGCGDGKSAQRLARFSEVVGADYSREGLLSLRSQRDPECRVILVVCNILSLPFESEKFSAVACVHTLSHMLERERRAAASELVRVLAPGGHILLEGFGVGDIRFGRGETVEDETFLRGDGVITHYFRRGEMVSMFPQLELVKELSSQRRVSFGTASGRRDILRVLLRKP